MSLTYPRAAFTMEEVQEAARSILHTQPDPIPAWRLLHEVLHLHAEDHLLRAAREAAAHSKWVKELEAAQLPDGSWGRFHSQDTKKKTVFRTSEEAIDRAFALGLWPDHPVLTQARVYIEKVLTGEAHITDREERNEAWPLLIKYILAGRLAQIDPANQALDAYWEFLAEVTRQAFTSGMYRLEDEVQAYLRITGVHVPQGFLESQHALWILSARPLPCPLEQALVEWIWNKPEGIRYLRVPLSEPQPRLIAYWLRSMNILTRFSAWREVSVDGVNQLWVQRDPQGCWDFGSRIASCVDFPLSESWRLGMRRKVDYSTSILALLRKHFD